MPVGGISAAANERAERVRPVEQARRTYMGRVVAQFMSYHGAPWLIRDERDREEATDRVLEQLDLASGMVVCDMGCGNGYYTLKMARQVAPDGEVLAVDIQRRTSLALKLPPLGAIFLTPA